jgi:pimeloyl-ACP methyl ester carboxylesterase
MSRINRLLTLLIGVSLLAGCSGKGSGLATTPQMSSGRGQLIKSPPTKLSSFTLADLLSRLSNNEVGQELLKLAFSLTCSIDVYQLQYETVGARGESTTASGALMVPTGTGSRCQGPRPILLYAHGASTRKSYNIADVANNGEGLLLAAVFASRGYIVVAPNYAGYDTSSLSYHPYLNADQQSNDMMDALTAARSAFASTNSSDDNKLFVTGYSQGGYVAMATHRALQAAGASVTASAPMSGPYAMAAFVDAVFEGRVTGGAVVNFTLLATSYQHGYGNLYSSPTDVFEAKYATGIDSLLPTTTTVGTLVSEGRLPSNALFNSTPPGNPPPPEFVAMTPATTPASLAPVFALGFGSDNLVTNNYRLNYLKDALANPDGGFPNVSTGLPAGMPGNTLRQALKVNDLRNWSPTSPVLLCAGNEDPVVLFLNTQLMQGYWTTNAPASLVTVLDVDSSPSSGDPYADLKKGFAVAKALVAANAVAGGATDGGATAVLQAYHTRLVPPFCLVAVTSFFDSH